VKQLAVMLAGFIAVMAIVLTHPPAGAQNMNAAAIELGVRLTKKPRR
jgi:hypothetical protein